MSKKLNGDLRIKIAEMVKRSGEGHIPSSYSIVDIINYLYGRVLKYDPKNMKDPSRDYFILSKGHGCGGLYVVLNKYGIISDKDILDYSTSQGILGGHPDMTMVPGAEASTGSLGHGFPTAMGLALGLKIKNMDNKVFALLGDGECHEGTIWESANVAANLKLGSLCAIIDWNKSGSQLMPIDDLPAKWKSFGWEVHEIDGHSEEEMKNCFEKLRFEKTSTPKVIIAHTIKGRGVSFTEGHGAWHHRVPSDIEMNQLINELA